jgi:glycosyltransferase involved in cell wall biosynthesis
MKSLPLITVITPSLNQGSFIEATIQSVLGQGYPNLEYIIVDGGSTDSTLDVLNRYSDRIRWISEKDTGQSDAINKALLMASGDVIAYLNSDDIYTPGTLLSIGKFFISHPEASWVTGQCRIINEHGIESRRLISLYKNFWLFFHSYTALLVIDYISQPATFWHRRVFETVGVFDETEQYAFDYDFSLRVGQHFKLFRLNRCLALFRIHPASKGSTAATIQFASDLAKAKRYTRSSLLITLHKWHNALILAVYQFIARRNSRP